MLPDTEALAIRYLADHPAVSAFGPRVHWQFDETLPQVSIRRVGGSAPWPPDSLDRANLDVDVWAETKQEARDLAETVRQAMFSAAGQVIDGVTICAAEEFSGPLFLPDDTPQGTPRYTFTISWLVH
jgi:hypothetical protein